MNRFVSLAAAIGASILSIWPDLAWAEKRVALVIGNSKYQTVAPLTNPSKDANSIAEMFRQAGFDQVDVEIDVGNLDLKRSIRKFETLADQADIAVVYYAGHGIEIGGSNYLIPIDARLASDRDADDEAIPLERMLTSVDGAKKLRVVILDACRDNPFTASMRHERKSGNRGVSAGLGKVEPTGTDTLIAYAAKAGSTAEDGDGQHSPFATGLLKNLTVPGLDIRLAFGRVRDDVMKITGNRQEPFVYGSLGGGIVSLMPAPADQQDSTVGDSKADYELVAKIGTRQAWEVFLGTHKAGFYADLARAQLASLRDRLSPTDNHSSNVTVPSIDPKIIGSGQETSREALEWDKIKDTSDQLQLRQFIQHYPNSPLSISAKRRLDLLQQSVRAHEDKARTEREETQKVAPDGRTSEGVAADNHEKDTSPGRRKSKRQAEREPIRSRPTSESRARQQANAHSSRSGGHSMISVGF
jgi:hypothetical protein